MQNASLMKAQPVSVVTNLVDAIVRVMAIGAAIFVQYYFMKFTM